MKLYFFPALLPLASVLPLLLAGLGVLAGLVRALQRNKIWGWISVILVLAGSTLWWTRRPPSLSSLPKIEVVVDSAVPVLSSIHRKKLLSDFWYQMTPRHSFSGLTLAPSGVLLVGTLERTVDAYDSKSGRMLWALPQTEPVLGEAVTRGSMAWTGGGLHESVRSRLTQFDLERREVIWQREVPGHIEMPVRPSADGATVYVAGGPSGVWALQTRDGSVVWHANLGHVDGTPLIAGETLYVTVQPDESKSESRLARLNVLDGKSISSISLPGLPWGAPTPMGRLIAFTTGVGQVNQVRPTDRGWIHAFDPTENRIVWSFELPGMALLTPIYIESNDTLIVTVKTGQLIAFGGKKGQISWSANLGGATMTSAHRLAPPHQNWLAAVSTAGQLHLIDALNGKTLHQEALGPNTTSSPTSNADALFVATPEGISAFHLGSLQ